jgi:hypothetical protein
MNQKPWIGFDLDGTLAVYTYWQGPTHIGEPIPTMIKKVRHLLDSGQRVKIFTARVCSTQPEGDREVAEQTIKNWCKKYIGQELEVTSEKDWFMIEFYDDRCIQVEYNTGNIVQVG